ncbi:MAG: DUF2203 family protein [Armatimonadetes bacterium]|nr:DUF2203 family protein [Armatimonadota bacterium]
MADEPLPSRVFTLEEANAMLPDPEARIERLRTLREEARRTRELLDILGSGWRPARPCCRPSVNVRPPSTRSARSSAA